MQQETTKQDKIREVSKKINKLRNEIKKILNHYLVDTSYYKLEVREGEPKDILLIKVWAGPRKGLGFIAKEIAKILKENGIEEVGKIILEYEFLKRKLERKAVIGEKIGEALSQKLKK